VTQSDTITALNQQPTPGTLVVLYQLDATMLGDENVRSFCSSVDTDQPIYFGGTAFEPVDFEATGFEFNGKGPLPTPHIRVSNTHKTLSGIVIDLKDLRGAKLTRIRTYSDFLDNGETPDPTALFAYDIYYVERKVAHNKRFIEFEMSAAIDQQGQKLPRRQVIREICTHDYRKWVNGAFDYSRATCPYDGVPNGSFDRNGVACADSADRCGKRLGHCLQRFGRDQQLPFRGFPGAAKVRL
jgi:lambda family phage minor tail protein L